LIYRFDVQDQYYDNMGGETGIVPIDAYYRTRWIDLGEPAIKKRWRRTEVVMQVEQSYDLPVVSYNNYDPSIPVKNFLFRSAPSPSSANEDVWDDPTSAWGNNDGSGSLWARSGNYAYVDRGANLGVARSVCLKVGGEVLSTPDPDVVQAPVFWGVDALIFKFVPRRVR
jgi:hypothetical protein